MVKDGIVTLTGRVDSYTKKGQWRMWRIESDLVNAVVNALKGEVELGSREGG